MPPEENTAVKDPGTEDTATAPATVGTDVTDTSNGNGAQPSADDFDEEDGAGSTDKQPESQNEDEDAEDLMDKPADEADQIEQPKPHTKEARTQQLGQEIADLKKELGLEPNADVRGMVAERNLLRELQQANSRSTELEVQQRLLDMTNPETGDYYTPEEAARLARYAVAESERGQIGVETYRLSVQRNQSVIANETQKAIQDFPIFSEKLPDGTDNPDYDPGAANLAGRHLLDAFVMEPVVDERGQKVLDANGQPRMQVVNIKSSPYQIMKEVAEQVARYKSQAEAKATTAAARQANGADIPINGNTAVKRPEAGADFDEAFDEYDAM